MIDNNILKQFIRHEEEHDLEALKDNLESLKGSATELYELLTTEGFISYENKKKFYHLGRKLKNINELTYGLNKSYKILNHLKNINKRRDYDG